LLTPTISETLAYRSGENNGEEFFSDFDEFWGLLPQSNACGAEDGVAPL
jgi:hypothetical protein